MTAGGNAICIRNIVDAFTAATRVGSGVDSSNEPTDDGELSCWSEIKLTSVWFVRPTHIQFQPLNYLNVEMKEFRCGASICFHNVNGERFGNICPNEVSRCYHPEQKKVHFVIAFEYKMDGNKHYHLIYIERLDVCRSPRHSRIVLNDNRPERWAPTLSPPPFISISFSILTFPVAIRPFHCHVNLIKKLDKCRYVSLMAKR